MKAQPVSQNARAREPFLTPVRLSWEANVKDEASPKVSVDTKDLSSTRHKNMAEGLVGRYRGNHEKAKRMAEHYRVTFPQGSGDHDFWARVCGHIDEMKQDDMWAGCLPRSAAVQPGSALLVAGEGAGARAWNDVGTRTEISPRAMHEEPKVKAQAARPKVNAATEERKEAGMDARYNRLIDSVTVRLTLNTVALAIWIAVSVGLLELAVKL